MSRLELLDALPMILAACIVAVLSLVVVIAIGIAIIREGGEDA